RATSPTSELTIPPSRASIIRIRSSTFTQHRKNCLEHTSSTADVQWVLPLARGPLDYRHHDDIPKRWSSAHYRLSSRLSGFAPLSRNYPALGWVLSSPDTRHTLAGRQSAIGACSPATVHGRSHLPPA